MFVFIQTASIPAKSWVTRTPGDYCSFRGSKAGRNQFSSQNNDKQPFTFKHSQFISHACFWNVGGGRKTLHKNLHNRTENTSTLGGNASGLGTKPTTVLLQGDGANHCITLLRGLSDGERVAALVGYSAILGGRLGCDCSQQQKKNPLHVHVYVYMFAIYVKNAK